MERVHFWFHGKFAGAKFVDLRGVLQIGVSVCILTQTEAVQLSYYVIEIFFLRIKMIQ